MKMTIKHMIRDSLFILIFVVLMVGLSFVFRPKNNSRDEGMDYAEANGILGEPRNTIDVLYIGDSEVYNGISPLEIWNSKGITGYDCATGAQQILSSWNFVEQAFETQNPRIVVIETTVLFRKFGVEKWFEEQLRYHFPMFRFHDRWKYLQANDFRFSYQTTWSDPLKGFRLFKKVSGFEPDEEYRKPTEKKAKMNRFSRLYLQKIQELCETHGAQLVLLSLPTTKNWNFSRHNSIQHYAEEHGLAYLDMNLLPESEFSIDWTKDTKDKGDHLNYTGAVKASEYLASYLAESFGLEDHRSDPRYQHWDAYWKTYMTLVNEN